ncbi:hypothetical protein GT642_12600 [Butyricicoccus sp. BIOML-A1]|nr:hypothetical protein [Butyricicoccus sp. BIOML-A1]
MFEVNDIPPIDGGALEQLIDEYAEHREFLFFRRNPGDDLDPFLGHEDGYECFCTKCRERFVRPLKEGPASHWVFCPVCHDAVTPKRWGDGNAKFLAAEAFLFSFFLRGRGREVWLVSMQVRMNPRFLESKYSGREVSRIVFYEGGAKRWKFDFMDNVRPVKRIAMPRWQYGCYGGAYPSYLAIDSAELRGSCLEYSCLDSANYALEDLAAYLALYCRYPAAVEHLVKRGFIFWLRERENRGGALFQRLINLRADSPKKLFRGLDRADLRVLLDAEASLGSVLFYRELRRAGAGRADKDSVFFAMTASAVLHEFSQFSALCADFGESPKEVRKYIERQARRADQTLHAALVELRDYREQLDRLGLDGGQLPPDLHEAHARLSERERRLLNRRKNEKFRTRRRLLAWMKWKWGGMFIRPIDSADEIVREGEEQNNCVAGYADRHADGKTIIMVLRKCSEPRKPWHTVEIDPKTLECRQCYAAHNHKRTPEAAEFMEKYLDHLREVTKMIRRSA